MAVFIPYRWTLRDSASSDSRYDDLQPRGLSDRLMYSRQPTQKNSGAAFVAYCKKQSKLREVNDYEGTST